MKVSSRTWQDLPITASFSCTSIVTSVMPRDLSFNGPILITVTTTFLIYSFLSSLFLSCWLLFHHLLSASFIGPISITKTMSRPTTDISDRLGASYQGHGEVKVDSALNTPFGLFGRLPREIREMIYIPVRAEGHTSLTRVRIFQSVFALSFDFFASPDILTMSDVYIGRIV